jgi:diguanylate cyclase (GGDEF)-like protein
MAFLSRASRFPAPVVLAVMLPVVALIGWLDFETGPVAMSLLYFVPIVFAAWVSGGAAAVIVALGAGVAWLVSEHAFMQHPEQIIFWNAFTRTTTFVVIAVMVGIVRQDRDQLDALNSRLVAALDVETRVARTDPLTGLPNTRSFREALDREVARSLREQSPISISYIDLDNFKRINDTMGHDAGDDVLRRVGEALRRSVRAEDLAARLGGDEFAILSVRPTREGLTTIATRIQAEVGEIARDFEGKGFGCTMGMILFPVAPKDAVAAVREADELMYEIKARSKGGFEVREHRDEEPG